MSKRNCTGCGSKRTISPANKRLMTQEKMMQMSEDESVLVELVAGQAEKAIYGVSRTFYGYRVGGEKFLIRKDDAKAQPHKFRPVEAQAKIARPPKRVAVKPKPMPKPRKIDLSFLEDEYDVEEIVLSLKDEEAVKPLQEDEKVDILEEVISSNKFDFSLIPGVTPNVKFHMEQAGLVDPPSILAAGVEGLQEVKYVGENRAKAIYKYVVTNFSVHSSSDS